MQRLSRKTGKPRRRVPVLRQRDMTECGTTCLAMIFKHYGLYNVQAALRRLAHVSAEGTDLYTLAEVAERFGFQADGYELHWENLPKITFPAIAHYDGNHFVVVEKVEADQIWIVDPGYGRDTISRAEFERRWNGILLTLEPTPDVFATPDVEELLDELKARKTFVRKEFYGKLFTPFRRVLIEIVAASFVLQLLALALPFFTQVIIDDVLVYQDRKLLYAILAGMVVILLTQVLLTYVRNILLTQFKVRFELDFFSKFFDHFIHLKQSFFDAYKREDFVNRFNENQKIREAFAPMILETFIDLLFVVNAVVVFFFYNQLLAFIALGFISFFVVLLYIYTPRIKSLRDKIFFDNLKAMGQFLDTLLGMMSVKLLGLERRKFWQWKNQYKRALNKVLAAEQTYIMVRSVLRAAYFISQVTVYWMGAYLTVEGTLTIGQYIAFVTIFSIAMGALNNVSGLWYFAAQLSVSYDRINDIFHETPEDRDLLTQHRTLERPRIALRELSFAYPSNPDRTVLDQITLTIEPGEHVALVGRNGSGKSTLAKLLVRLYDEYEGNLTVGGIEVQRIHPQALRKAVALVPQEVYLFSGTLKENIRYARPDATMAEVIEAARLADLHEFVAEQYLGYNFMVGEGGGNLSGGQRLKVAFARLFLSRPEVIILDEASSALDVEAERRVLDNVRAHFREQTVISIAHRLHTVRQADRILVLEHGRIVEDGPHDALLHQGGLYQTLMHHYVNF